MKQILNFIPLIFFFVFLNLYDIFVAVQALMISSTIVMLVFLILFKSINKIELFSYVMVMVFGALTLILHNKDFIKWKVTLINFAFALVLLGSQLFFKKNLLKSLLGKEIVLAQSHWNKINLFWAIFFIIIGLFSLYVTYYTSDDFFGTFKTFILPGATLLVTILTGFYIHKNGQQLEDEK